MKPKRLWQSPLCCPCLTLFSWCRSKSGRLRPDMGICLTAAGATEWKGNHSLYFCPVLSTKSGRSLCAAAHPAERSWASMRYLMKYFAVRVDHLMDYPPPSIVVATSAQALARAGGMAVPSARNTFRKLCHACLWTSAGRVLILVRSACIWKQPEGVSRPRFGRNPPRNAEDDRAGPGHLRTESGLCFGRCTAQGGDARQSMSLFRHQM